MNSGEQEGAEVIGRRSEVVPVLERWKSSWVGECCGTCYFCRAIAEANQSEGEPQAKNIQAVASLPLAPVRILLRLRPRSLQALGTLTQRSYAGGIASQTLAARRKVHQHQLSVVRQCLLVPPSVGVNRVRVGQSGWLPPQISCIVPLE